MDIELLVPSEEVRIPMCQGHPKIICTPCYRKPPTPACTEHRVSWDLILAAEINNHYRIDFERVCFAAINLTKLQLQPVLFSKR